MMKIRLGIVAVICFSYLISCSEAQEDLNSEKPIDESEYFYNVLGEKYFFNGDFLGGPDSLEHGTWNISRFSNPIVLYGRFERGSPIGDWTFVLSDGVSLTSRWMKYRNEQTKSGFSIPFDMDEMQVDSNSYKLSTVNDSLGQISIGVAIRTGGMTERDIFELGDDADKGLRDQGFTFKRNRDTIIQMKNAYYYTEYFLNDNKFQPSKLYNIYGYTTSGKHFVEISFFHTSPKEELAQVIFSMITSGIFVDGDRFFNPFRRPIKF